MEACMYDKAQKGDYLWRGGERIPVEKEESVFTAVVHDEEELERVRSLPGVHEVRPLETRIVRVYVDEQLRDRAMEEFRKGDDGGVAHHAYRPSDATNTRYYLTDQIVVAVRPDVGEERVEAILADAGVRLMKVYPGQSRTLLVQVMDDAGMNPIKVANALAELPEVEYAEPNLVNRFETFYVPADPLFARQWHLHSAAGLELAGNAHVSAVEAWDLTRGSRDVVVAVLDDGFDLSHPDFTGPGKVVHPKDYVDGDSHPFPESAAGDYHGTPCAGVAIAEENGVGVVGIAPGCAFMPVRFPLHADDDLMWEIFDFVGSRADVISCSWGPVPVYAPLSTLVRDKFSELAETGGPRKKGCVIVFAAGNYNAPLNDPHNTVFRWRHPRLGLVQTTGRILNGNATHPGVIAVAAMTSLNRKSTYSNWGDEIAVCAPSNNFHPLEPGRRVPGLGIWTTDNEAFGHGFTGGSRFTGQFGGTSSATPLVAGICALMISANPALTAAEVKQILQETADKLEDAEPDLILVTNRGSYDAAGRCAWFGFGRANAARAVRRARELAVADTGILDLSLPARVHSRLDDTGATQLFRISVEDRLSLRLRGPAGEDFDLYLRREVPPTTERYDAVGFTSSPNEHIVISPVEAGEYYVMVRSYRGAGEFDLEISLE
jgi:subtilisin family serine protease